MEFISSDTNIWMDFNSIHQLDLPFRLSYQYIMYEESLDSELGGIDKISEKLIKYGLLKTKLSLEEFWLASSYGDKYKRLSKHDRIALAIAKHRNIKLLTGDGNLRNAAIKENVEVVGTIWILDKLKNTNSIVKEEYIKYINELISLTKAGKRRLPIEELLKRLNY